MSAPPAANTLSKSIIIFGADGYIGWPLAIHLGARHPNRKVILVDNLSTRKLVKSVGSFSLVPIRTMEQRIARYREVSGKDNIEFVKADLRNPESVDRIFSKYLPESVVHLAQQRSAPFSMIDQEHAIYTQLNNITTNMNIIYSMARHAPEAHLLKMGSMGEYGTPEVDISEGDFEVERNGRRAKMMFPRAGQSWYHLSKIFDTHNVKLASKVFDLTATDIMQGIVFGTRIEETLDPILATRLDFDSIWGTLVNKYVVQSVVSNKLLIYGRGKQRRGFLSLYDSINCLTLLLENPPSKGEYRVVNQLDETFDTLELAEKVREVGRDFGIHSELEWIENPRMEKEEHHYGVEHKILPSLGFKQRKSMEEVLAEIFETVLRYRQRAVNRKELLYPSVYWKSGKVYAVPNFRIPRELMRVKGTHAKYRHQPEKPVLTAIPNRDSPKRQMGALEEVS
ncbi:MAG: NAD-dependent epimerase/dehydratase family protein [Nitrososphaerota archaeon]|nr:NAD-dependent epimerase/dehydratase family protein [Nitrososphaerota archaeon]